MNTHSTLTITEKESPSALAAAWLLRSGIQNRGEDPEFHGGVNAWFDIKDHTYPFVYAEITGYAVNAFLFEYALTSETAYLAAACKAADWLQNHQYPESGLVRTRLNHTAFDKAYFDDRVFTFDQWMAVFGLANLFEATQETRYLEHAEKMAGFLLEFTVRENGFFYPMWRVADKRPEETGDKWSRQSGGFHAKALMGLEKLYGLTQKSLYREAAIRLARKTVSMQQGNGRFVTQEREGSTHLHPHLYTLEGLLSFGLSVKEDRFIHAAEKGLRWVMARQRDDGSIYAFFREGSFRPFVRADILAQTLRLGGIFTRLGRWKAAEKRWACLREKLLTYQITEGPQRGGFLYGQEEDGSLHYHVNAWVTMFAAQALSLFERTEAGRPSSALSFFV